MTINSIGGIEFKYNNLTPHRNILSIHIFPVESQRKFICTDGKEETP